MSNPNNNNMNNIFDFSDTPAAPASTAAPTNYNNAASNFTPVHIDTAAWNNTTSVDMSNNNNNVNAEANGTTVPAEDTRTYKGVHPIAALFHVIFKLAALLMFIFGKLFSANYIVMFVITVLLCAADFWVTKNVTGRILVALRWWNQVNEDGTSQWVFESAPDNDNRVNSYDRWFFWIVLGGYTVIWGLLTFFCLLSFSYLPLTVLGLMLGGSNLMGYIKCSREAKSQLSNFVMQKAMENPGMVASAATNMFSSTQPQK